MGWGVFCTANPARRVHFSNGCVSSNPVGWQILAHWASRAGMLHSWHSTLTSKHRMVVESICLTENLPSLEVFHETPAFALSEAGEIHVHNKAWPMAMAPVTRPVALIDNSRSLCHMIHLVDEETPKHTGKPAGVKGVEIWAKTGSEPPMRMDEMTILALDSGSPHEVGYTTSEAGQTAYYLLRWIGQDETKGPWSRLFSATITI
jgi:hypothetical protein